LIWEIVIKRALGKVDIPAKWADALADEPFRRMPLPWEHALEVRNLPDIHRDPFDRLLVAQAKVEDLTFVTGDTNIPRYRIASLKA
jgi:PIN domain nuclease of toxin-antitoxin system